MGASFENPVILFSFAQRADLSLAYYIGVEAQVVMFSDIDDYLWAREIADG